MVVYIRAMCKHHQTIYTAALAGTNWKNSNEIISELEDIHHINRDNMPVSVIFHVVAQAVRIHDMADYILRSKLDYLAKMQFGQLADSDHQWADMQDWAMREHEGKPMSVPSRLQDPSWVEENRVMNHLWTLVACARAARMLTHRNGEVVRMTLTEVQQVLSDLRETARRAEEADEIITSISHGPVLEAPARTARVSPPNEFSHSVLQTYPIQHPPYSNIPIQNFGISGLYPQFSQSPAPYTTPVHESLVWDRHSKALTRSNNITGFVQHPLIRKHVRDHNARACRLGCTSSIVGARVLS